MMKKYLIYWEASNQISGNTIIEFNPKKIMLKDLFDNLIDGIKNEPGGHLVDNISIKFMVKLK